MNADECRKDRIGHRLTQMNADIKIKNYPRRTRRGTKNLDTDGHRKDRIKEKIL